MTIESQLAQLAAIPPSSLERRTVAAVGAGDLVAAVDSHFGPLWVAWSTVGVTAVTPAFAAPSVESFIEHHRRVSYETTSMPSALETQVEEALSSGTIGDVRLDLRGISDFQRSVLESCASIPVGHVRPYGWIAEDIHKPGATRAVGTALSKNPIPLLIPCHRVVRSDGSIGNYAFGSEMKRELLVQEGAIAF